MQEVKSLVSCVALWGIGGRVFPTFRGELSLSSWFFPSRQPHGTDTKEDFFEINNGSSSRHHGLIVTDLWGNGWI